MDDIRAVYEIPLEEADGKAEYSGTSHTLNTQAMKEALTRILDSLHHAVYTGNVFFDNYDVWIPSGLRTVVMEDILGDKLGVRIDRTGTAGTGYSRIRGSVKLPVFSERTLPTRKEAQLILDSLTTQGKTAINYPESQCRKALAVRGNSEQVWYDIENPRAVPGGNKVYQTMIAYVIHVEGPILWYVIKNAMIPSGLSEKEKADLQSMYRMIEGGFLNVDGTEIVVTKKLKALQGEELRAALSSLADEVTEESATSTAAPGADTALDALLKADFIRADITPENRRKLENPNGGIWELWELLRRSPGATETVKLSAPVYARPPKLDVAWHEIIGIDFGTKSTVVAREIDGNIDLVRVGTGDYRSGVSRQQYENPTVLQFVDLERFLRDFHARGGRPLTRWADVNTSHTALEIRNGLSGSDGPVYFPSFFSELKQWASGSRGSVRIMDRRGIQEHGQPRKLKPFLTIQDTDTVDGPAYCAIDGAKPDLNPIVYYAYYVGLYINNMRTGRIGLKYLLSFPVSYSREVREKIRRSFEVGLRKSLPESILRDEECMEAFYVKEGAAEPAAYAVCALRQFGIVPEVPVRFAVFDFGGGTSDFDLGIWRRPEGRENRRGVRYVIEHCAYGGAEYLGGENLILEMAYRTFWDNADTLRREGVQFACPAWIKPEAGFEYLIDDTLEAQVNLRTLSELLRPVWEGKLRGSEEDGYSIEPGSGGGYDFDESGITRLPLFDENGKQKQVEIQVNVSKLLQLIRARIEDGVRKFLDMVKSFALSRAEGDRKCSPVMDIFLAGNSSQSGIFREVIDARISELNESMRGIWGERYRGDPPKSFFEIFAPLGTEEAEKQIQEYGDPDTVLPDCTGKTGVAMGLLLTRSGSGVKVIDTARERDAEEIRFRYWVGDIDARDCLHPYLTPGSAYEEWVEYWDAGEESFDIYYTASPTAGMPGGVSVRETKARQFLIPPKYVDETRHIYLRAVKPDSIECAVAESPDDARDGRLLWKSSPIRL